VRSIGDLSRRWRRLISGFFEKRKSRPGIARNLALGSRGEDLAAISSAGTATRFSIETFSRGEEVRSILSAATVAPMFSFLLK